MKRLVYIDVLKAFASLLIFNFHSFILFPEKISILSFGGDIGNNLFFMISGFLLYSKINKYSINDFSQYYLPRLKRILPSVLLFYILSMIFCNVEVNNFYDIVVNFVFPSMFWFASAILFFYLFVFYQIKLFSKQTNFIIVLILLLLHVLFDGILVERYVIGYISILCGYYINEYFDAIKNKSSIFVTLLFLILYAVLKVLYKYGINPIGLVHLFIGIFIIAFCINLIALFSKYEFIIDSFLSKHIYLSRLINIVSSCTLEIYILGVYNNLLIERMINKYFSFPFSYIICLCIIVCISYMIYCVWSLIWKKKKIRKQY